MSFLCPGIVFLTETCRKDTPRHALMGQRVLEHLTMDGV